MSVTRQQIIDEARSWEGTPWRHQGRLKGIACDCVGFIIKVPVALGLYPANFDVPPYPRTPDPKMMLDLLNAYMDRVEPADLRRQGDVLWLAPNHLPQHVAIYITDRGYPTMIHAIDEHRGVAEHRLDYIWERAISGVWKYRGINE
jgi:cell wall-associated NlpC family hydrolase